MSVNFKALGGMFEFRYINDVEDLDLDDLQDLYNDLKEEQKEFNSELDRLKGIMKNALSTTLRPMALMRLMSML